MKKLFNDICYFIKELAGENQYERYLKDAQIKKISQKLMTQKEFYLHQTEKKWNRINRCC